MQRALLFSLLLLLSACRTQLITPAEIIIIPVEKPSQAVMRGPSFQGNLFMAAYPEENFFHAFDSVTRFTPTQTDLAEAETILLTQLRNDSRFKHNQNYGARIIYRNLSKYFRQYVGFTDKQGDRTIHISLYWNRRSISQIIHEYSIDTDSRLDYNSPYTWVLDGGSAYGQAEVNLTKKKLTAVGINGVG